MPSKAEFCNREYDNRLLIANSEQILARWSRQAEKARGTIPNRVVELIYGSPAGERLDLFRAARSDSALLVFIHGGYWRSVNKSYFSWVAPPYVDASISVAVLIDGLVPEVAMESWVRQQLPALTSMWDGANKLGFAREKIVVSGLAARGRSTVMMLAATL